MTDLHHGFYRTLIRLAIPIFITQLLGSLLGIVDTFMVSSLGDDALAAVGIGSQFLMLLFMVQFGLMSGFGIFIAQYNGAKEYDNVSKTYLLAVTIGLSIALGFLLVAQLVPTTILRLFNLNETPNRNVIDLGVDYIRIASFAFLTSTISFSISMLARSVHKVVVVSIIQSTGILINTVLNYVLIHGHAGFPEMGVAGAALATLISSSLMMIASVTYLIVSREPALHIRLSHRRAIDRTFVRHQATTVVPVVFNETFWGLAMTLYVVAYGLMGEQEVGSIYLSNQINSLFWVVTISIANAAAIMLGNKLGENDLVTAKEWELRFRRLGILSGVFVGVLLFVLTPTIVHQFQGLSDVVRDTVTIILRIYAVYAPIKFLNAIFIVGTLRAGGDTRFALIADLGALWVYGVPLAFLLAYFSSLPLPWIVVFVHLEEFIKFGLLYTRVRRGKWINNLTADEEQPLQPIVT
jgi:putative MATE family efflux protein